MSKAVRSVEEKFWDNVERRDGAEGCWSWRAHKTVEGYGVISAGSQGGRLLLRAHRVSWELHRGPIPDGMVVCHKARAEKDAA